MKRFIISIILLCISLSSFAQDLDSKVTEFIPEDYINHNISYMHGGKNGGGTELELRIMAKRIVSFVVSEEGRKIFPEVNTEYIKRILKSAQISVGREKLLDRYRSERTCLADPYSMTIECNLNLWGLIKDPRVYYVLLFHEILGLMNLELGHYKDVSRYPISSKLIDHVDKIHNSNYSVQNLTPEFFSLDADAFGAIVKSKKGKETLRLICYDKVELHECENFAFVRKSLKFKKQAPLLIGLEPLNYQDLMSVQKSLNRISDKAHMNKKRLSVLEYVRSLMNVNRSFDRMGVKLVVRNQSTFEQVESLINHLLNKLRNKRIEEVRND